MTPPAFSALRSVWKSAVCDPNFRRLLTLVVVGDHLDRERASCRVECLQAVYSSSTRCLQVANSLTSIYFIFITREACERILTCLLLR